MWISMAFAVWVLVVNGLPLARAGLFEQLKTGGETDGACPVNTDATVVAWSNGRRRTVPGA